MSITRYAVLTPQNKIVCREFKRETARLYVEACGIRWPKRSSTHHFFEDFEAARTALLERLATEDAETLTRLDKIRDRIVEVTQMTAPRLRR